MDQSKLIDEILARVNAKLAEKETLCAGADPAGEPSAGKPGLLVLCQTEDQCCCQILSSSTLKDRFHVTCVCRPEEMTDLSAQSCVVLCQLTNDVLSKLALGICDTPYTRLASQAILMGKRVYILTEQVELYRYAATAPAPYYAALEAHLDLLTASGAVICSQNNLECMLAGPAGDPPAACPAAPCCERELRLDKGVLTERDVKQAAADKVTCIRLPAKCILTALARDYAKEQKIRLERA